MGKKSGPLSMLVALVAWLTGVLVSLAVGFGMVDKVLTVQWIHPTVTMVAGWIVVILTLVSVILAILDRLS
jgi:hypothetical protein